MLNPSEAGGAGQAGRLTVSVIVPAHNAARFLPQALASAGSQIRLPDEILVVDDGSTDGAADGVVRAGTVPVRVLRQERRGPAAARNAGAAAARGDALAFLDADDLWCPGHLLRCLACLEEDPSLGIAQGLIQRLRWRDGSFQPELFPYPFVNLGSMVVRRSVYRQTGGLSEELWENEDTDWLLRCWEHSVPKRTLDQVSLYYRLHNTNMVHSQNLKAGGVAFLVRRHLQRLRSAGASTERQTGRPGWEVYRGAPPPPQPDPDRAEWLARQGRAAEAVEQARQDLAQTPTDEEKQKLLCSLLWERGGEEAALRHCGLTRLDPRPVPHWPEEVLALTMVRDDRARLPFFLRYYRQQGVDRFLVVDHASTDGSREFLLEQPDVHLWSAEGAQIEAPAWAEVLLRAHGRGRWCVLADTGEYVNAGGVRLRQLCRRLEETGKRAASGLRLEVYAERPLAWGDDPLEERPFCDRPDWLEVGHLGEEAVLGGVSPILRKIPLVHYDVDLLLTAGQQRTNLPASRLAEGAVVVLHPCSQAEAYDPAVSVRWRDCLDGLGMGPNSAPCDEPEAWAPEQAGCWLSVTLTVEHRLEWLSASLRSVLVQVEEGWHVCVLQDAVDPELREKAARVVAEVGQGRVELRSAEQPLGPAGLFQLAAHSAQGRWLHVLPEGDGVEPGFYEALRRGAQAAPQAGLLFSRWRRVDDSQRQLSLSLLELDRAGLVPDWLERVAVAGRLEGAAVLLRRDRLRELGGCRPQAGAAFLGDLWTRLAALAPAWFEPEVLAYARTPQPVPLADLGRVIALNEERAGFALSRLARRKLAREGLIRASRLRDDHPGPALDALAEVLRLDAGPDLVHDLRRALPPRPPDLARELGRLRGWLHLGQPQRAIEETRRLLERQPDSEPLLRFLLEQLLEQNRAAEGLEVCQRLLEGGAQDVYLQHNHEICLRAWEEQRYADQENGKLCLFHQLRFPSHRSGWAFALDALRPLHHRQGVLFDGFLENNFAWRHPERSRSPQELQRLEKEGWWARRHASSEELGLVPYRQPWVGFLHNPAHMPSGFMDEATPQAIMRRSTWRESLETCQGLFTLSESLAQWWREATGLPVESVVAPTETPDLLFDPERFLANPRPKIVQVGWWLRRLTSIFRLPVRHHYRKIWLVTLPFPDARSHFLELMRREGGRPDCPNTGEMTQLSNEAYDRCLSENLVFLDLYDASANNAVLECMARATPLLVNPLPAVVEYLGPGYPLYYQSLSEAAEKAMDFELVLAAHVYLKAWPRRAELSAAAFRQAVERSPIYRGLRR